MTKGKKILLLVCMNLMGVVVIFAMFMHKREISKYDNAVVAKARVRKKQTEYVTEGRSEHADRYIYIALPIDGDTAYELVSHDYMDDDIYKAAKPGTWINVTYLKESVESTDNGGLEVTEKIYLKEGLDEARARLPWYWLYGGICCFIGFLPYIFQKKKK